MPKNKIEKVKKIRQTEPIVRIHHDPNATDETRARARAELIRICQKAIIQNDLRRAREQQAQMQTSI